MVMAVSCNKDAEISDTDSLNKLKHNTKERQEKIIEFLEFVKHKDVDLGSRSLPFTMKTKEAIPFLEESLNLGFCRLDSSFYEDYHYAYDTVFIQVSNDSISSADLTDAFDSIAHFAAIEYGNRPVSTRKSILFGLTSDYVVDTIRNGILVACLYVVAEDIGVTYKSGNYDVDDYWHYCCGGGKCGPYSGGQPNDAARILTRDLKKVLVPSLLNRAYYFIEPYSICFSPGSSCNEPNSNIIYDEYVDEFGYDPQALWYDHSDCLSPTDLTFHFDAIQHVLNDNRPFTSLPPSLKSIVAVSVGHGQTVSIPPTYVHDCGVTYGTLVELKAEAPAPFDLTEY
jgi:hypothetical protein